MNSIIHQNDRSILGPSDATDRPPAVLGAGARAWGDAVEAQAVGVATIVRRRRPIVPVATPTVRRRRSEDAGVDEVIGEGSD